MQIQAILLKVGYAKEESLNREEYKRRKLRR
jgi:hypothetical protein